MSRPRWSQPSRWPGLVRGAASLLRRGSHPQHPTGEHPEPWPITNPASADLRELLHRHATRVTEALGDPATGRAFERLMLNTWQTTMTRRPDQTTFVITGDIPAMWLRDSSAQLRPFVLIAPQSDEVVGVLLGTIAQQWDCIERAPYANAFNPEPNNASWHAGDLCDNPWVWEEKYEIDSLAFPIQLAWQTWKATGRSEAVAPLQHRARLVTDLWRTEQDHRHSPYRFVRPGTGDTLGKDGRGAPVAVTGMTWSGFRPSDDPCTFGYNIPAQLFAAHALDLLAEMAEEEWFDVELVDECQLLAAEIRAGVRRHGFAAGGPGQPGQLLAYEVDGLGGQLLMDDANMPSLLSLPLCSSLAPDDPVYRATRRWVLSQANPHYHLGAVASGVGSPHTPEGYIWPIALAVQGLTSTHPETKRRMVEALMRTDGGTGMMHESFDADDPGSFTRPWFSWANSMFCELLLEVAGLTMADLTGTWHGDW